MATNRVVPDNKVVANRVDPDNKIIANLNIVDNTEFTTNYADVVANRVDPDNKIIANLNIVDNTEFTTNYADVVANRVDPDNKIIANLNIVDNTEFTTNYADVVANRVDPDNIGRQQIDPIANLNIVDNTEFTTNSADVDTSRAVKANINNAAINSDNNEGWDNTNPIVEIGVNLDINLARFPGQLWGHGWYDWRSPERIQRSDKPDLKTKDWRSREFQVKKRVNKLGTTRVKNFHFCYIIQSTATSTVSLTTVSERMPSPTPAVQPHWKATTKLTSKGKELENKSVKDQRPGFKENDMRDHLSGYNDEDEDHLKLDTERPDEEEDQGPNLEDEQDDVHNQVSRYWDGIPKSGLWETPQPS